MDHNPNNSILALDIGAVRVGVALANAGVRMASPLVTLDNDEDIFQGIQRLCNDHRVSELCCGLPRGLNGQETPQTAYAREFAAKLPSLLGIPVYLIDEALTSVRAKEELDNRGRPYKKGEVDALAATYILEDYLSDGGNAEQVA